MARVTKKQIIDGITNTLKNNPGSEVCISKYQNKLRNGRWGLHAYALCYNSGEVMCRPWAGANVYWRADLTRLTRDELEEISGRMQNYAAYTVVCESGSLNTPDYQSASRFFNSCKEQGEKATFYGITLNNTHFPIAHC